jgi:hypothetical protein
MTKNTDKILKHTERYLKILTKILEDIDKYLKELATTEVIVRL